MDYDDSETECEFESVDNQSDSLILGPLQGLRNEASPQRLQ